MKLLLEDKMEELHDWFNRLYGPRGHKLEIYTKKTGDYEEYVIDLNIHRGPWLTLPPTRIPNAYLEDIQMRLDMKEGALPRWQRAIMNAIQ